MSGVEGEGKEIEREEMGKEVAEGILPVQGGSSTFSFLIVFISLIETSTDELRTHDSTTRFTGRSPG